MKITFNKGGTGERTVELRHVEIHDLWHIAHRCDPEDCSKILEVWHMAHDLRRTLEEAEAALRKVKLTCLTTTEPALKALGHIVRICLDAGVTEKLPELQARQ